MAHSFLRFPSPHGIRVALRALACALLLGALLAACGSEPPAPTPCPEPLCPEPRPCPEPQVHPKAPAQGHLESIAQRGTLRCGVRDNVIPFGFSDEHTGHVIGFEVDICRALAHSLNVRLELVTVTSSTRIPLLLSGEIDLIAATMTHHNTRENDLDFSITYFMDGQKLLVRRGSPIHSATDLAGHKTAAVQDSWASGTLREVQPKVRVKEFAGYAEAFLALKRGAVEAMTADSTILLGLKNSDDNTAAWTIAGDFITDEPYALGLPENDSDFRDYVNLKLQELWLSGEYMKIYNRWFGPHTKYYLPTDWQMEIWPGATGKE